MKKVFKFSFLCLLILFISGCEKNYMKEISYSEYEKLIEDKETFILEVMKTDCSACINFEPKIKAVANEYKLEIKYINIANLSDEEHDALTKKTGVSATPTVIFYNDGEEKTVASRINGSVSKEKIITKFKANGFIAE